MVQVRGRLRIVEGREWLLRLVEDLTAAHESGRPAPWAVADAPAAFIEAQLKGIVGVEVEIARIEGKWKVSQNRHEADRRGVAEGLDASPGEAEREMARLVEGSGGPKG
jgi:transcriptional regulator